MSVLSVTMVVPTKERDTMTEFEFNCSECVDDHTFVGDTVSASAECEDGTTVELCPAEIYESWKGEAEGDAYRDRD